MVAIYAADIAGMNSEMMSNMMLSFMPMSCCMVETLALGVFSGMQHGIAHCTHMYRKRHGCEAHGMSWFIRGLPITPRGIDFVFCFLFCEASPAGSIGSNLSNASNELCTKVLQMASETVVWDSLCCLSFMLSVKAPMSLSDFVTLICTYATAAKCAHCPAF